METKTSIRVRLKIGNDPLDLVWKEQIIGVQQRQQLAPAGGKCGVKSRSLSSIRLADQPQACVFSLVFLDNANRVIGRSVVADDQFYVGIRLAERTLNRFPNVPVVVVI